MKQIEKIPESIRNILDKVKTFFPENPQFIYFFNYPTYFLTAKKIIFKFSQNRSSILSR